MEEKKNAAMKWNPQFMLVPSLNCPARCGYCFGPNDGPVMDVSMVRQVIDYIKLVSAQTGRDKVRVTLHGGEPLAAGVETVAALIKGLYERFSATGLELGVQSNLWLLDERYCELFARYGVAVSTSLDGPKGLNDGQRGEGCFDKTMRGIRLARSYGINVGIITTFTARTAARWREVFDFFLTQELPFCVHHSVPAIGKATEYELPADRYAALFLEMFSEYVCLSKKIKISSFDQVCRGIAYGEGAVCTFRDCFGMFLVIDPRGDIFSCQRFAGRPEFRLGNIAAWPRMDHLTASPAGVRLLMREQKVKEQCGGCEHYSYCKGGCAYNAYAQEADDAPDPFCEAYKKIFSMVKERLYRDMVSDENVQAVAQFGPSEKGNPLLRRGPVIDLADAYTHPFDTAKTARRIVMAYELAKGPNVHESAGRLMEMKLFTTKLAAEAAISTLQRSMLPQGLNKLYLHVTWNCQLKCSHCYACAGEGTQTDGTRAEDIVKLICSASGAGFKEAVLTGGEPLLLQEREVLLQELSSIRRKIKPLKIVLRTNFAMPLTSDDYMLLSEAFDEIVVSVDGGKTEHDLRRGEGAYDKTVLNLEQYQNLFADNHVTGTHGMRPARLSISATMKADEVNSRKGTDVTDLGRRLRIRHVKFRPLLPLGRALELHEPIVSEALRAYQTPLELTEEGFHPTMSCGIGQNLYVEPSGDAFPCYSYHKPHSFLGNVVRDGLNEVLQRDAFQLLKGYTVDSNAGCRSCEYRYLCGGACRAWGRESAQGDLNATPIDCEGLRERARKLYAEAINYLRH